MRLFGLTVTRAAPGLTPVSDNRGGWWPMVREAFAGAWQRNIEWTTDTVLAHHAVYACITRIAQDIGKLRPKLVEQDDNGIWKEVTNTAHSPVLRKPNRFQNHIQFKEWWAISKLTHGNTYVLLERDQRKVVQAMYILDPTRVQVLVSPDGAVFYNLKRDNLSGLEQDDLAVPASEMIHDRINCIFHPLVGTSPIFASGAAANMGLKIQRNSTTFFGNASLMSGILSSPNQIDPKKAEELSDLWNARFGPGGQGGVAVVGNGMKYEKMQMTATDAQLIEQLQWSAETVCSTFHVPPWKIGIGQQPAYTKPEIANQAYYSDCLQSPIEQWELCMDHGLGIGEGVTIEGRELGIELDLDGLLRMDVASQITTLAAAVGGSVYTVNEARAKVDLKPVDGGDEIWMQQQNYSLPALAKRDAKVDPFGTTPLPAPQLPAPEPQKQLPAGDSTAQDAARSVETGWFVREYMEESFRRIADGLDTQFRSLKDEIQKAVPVPEPVKELPAPKEEPDDSDELWEGWFARDALTLVQEARAQQRSVIEETIRANHDRPLIEQLAATVTALAERETVIHVAAPTISTPPIELTVNVDAKRAAFKAKASRNEKNEMILESVE